MLDKMLDREGKYVNLGQRCQEWLWKVEGNGEVFRPRRGKVHIKFDEDAEELGLKS